MDTPSNDDVYEKAAHWVVQISDGELTEAAREELSEWVSAFPEHADEFRACQSIVSSAPEISHEARERLIALAAADAGRVSWARRERVWFAAAATVLVALGLAAWFYVQPAALVARTYATGTGEVRTVSFDDGSVAYLNTRTRLRWIGGAYERRVELLEGEALFDVAHDRRRPFFVIMDDSEIRVLGTRFNVYRREAGDIVVTVLEGDVEVRESGSGGERPAWQRSLHANQQIVYRDTGLMRDVHETVATRAVRWRDGVLQIEDEPLPEVVEELTRYTERRIVIRDPRLSQYRIGGALNVRDVRAALARLEKVAPVTVKESGDTFTLSYRSDLENVETQQQGK